MDARRGKEITQEDRPLPDANDMDHVSAIVHGSNSECFLM
jgi:hypothetical protein